MWTPKRILMLTLGFIVFLAAYLAYGRVLGRIDGLPPLPEAYWPPDQPSGVLGRNVLNGRTPFFASFMRQ